MFTNINKLPLQTIHSISTQTVNMSTTTIIHSAPKQPSVLLEFIHCS
jgi:hypothetical protein